MQLEIEREAIRREDNRDRVLIPARSEFNDKRDTLKVRQR
jgi:hypothetical protein